jgi:hypothetical protein
LEYQPQHRLHKVEVYTRRKWSSVFFCGREDEKAEWQCKYVAKELTMANGISGTDDDSHIFIVETIAKHVGVYRRDEKTNDLSLVRYVPTNSGCDNIDVAPDGSASMGCHPKMLTFTHYKADPFRRHSPSQVLVWKNPLESDILEETLYTYGETLSGSSFAARIGSHTIVGGVYHPGVLVCDSTLPSYASTLPTKY